MTICKLYDGVRIPIFMYRGQSVANRQWGSFFHAKYLTLNRGICSAYYCIFAITILLFCLQSQHCQSESIFAVAEYLRLGGSCHIIFDCVCGPCRSNLISDCQPCILFCIRVVKAKFLTRLSSDLKITPRLDIGGHGMFLSFTLRRGEYI